MWGRNTVSVPGFVREGVRGWVKIYLNLSPQPPSLIQKGRRRRCGGAIPFPFPVFQGRG